MQETIQLGDPVEHDGVVITPLFPRRTPKASYLTLGEALPLGLEVGEVAEAATAPELVVHNPLEANVLLYDGEELVGAMQNRILNVSVLVSGRSAVKIPVSCVEQGRWSRRTRRFAKGGHAYPELRRQKAASLRTQPLARGAAQGAVWQELSSKSARFDVHSQTGAQADIFSAQERSLEDLRKVFPVQPGQSGAVVVLGDRVCLDWLSRPEAFSRLYPKLLDGYLLDAIDSADMKCGPRADLGEFLASLGKAASTRQPSVGLGEDVRLEAEGIIGSGLALEGELVQLSAYSADGQHSGAAAA
jgi:hypothetical protein